MARSTSRKGAALILSMIFLLIFSALAASMATLSTTNVQVSDNQRQANRALVSAQSGLEVMRYYLSGIKVSGTITPANRLQAIAAQLQSKLSSAGVTNIVSSYDASTNTVTIPSVLLSCESSQAFNVVIGYGNNGSDYDAVTMDVTGTSQQVSRKIRTGFNFATVGNPIFDWGIATKGPLNMQGNVEVEGFNENIEASVYIESLNSILALQMTGKSSIAGKVTIANSVATVDISNSSSVFGAQGAAAMNHITIGDTRCEFPTPNPAQFVQYIQHTFNPAVDPTSNVTLTNVEIPANTNPSFSGQVVIRGIMYVRAPNVVRFTGNAEIHGLILAEGDLDNPSPANFLDFAGTVNSYDASTLPPEQFGALTEKTGTFILAPGFRCCFGGDFETLNGVIAASGVEFHGNAGGKINGSVINYSDDCMSLAGNTDLVFNRSGMQKCPAGFEPTKVLQFLPSSYCEPAF